MQIACPPKRKKARCPPRPAGWPSLLAGVVAFFALLALAGGARAARPPKTVGFLEVRLWDLASGEPMSLLSLEGVQGGYGGYLRSLLFSPDGMTLTVPIGADYLKVWETQTGRPLPDRLKEYVPVTALTFLPGGKELIAADGGGVKVWKEDDGQPRYLIKEHFRLAALSVDGSLCAAELYDSRGQESNSTNVYRTRTGERIHQLKTPRNRFLAFCPGGKRLATVSYAYNAPYTIHLWDMVTGREALSLPGSDPLAFSPGGNTLALWGEGGKEIVLFHIPTGEAKRIRHGYIALHSLAFSPDGKVLASGGQDERRRTQGGVPVEAARHTIRLWDTSTGELKQSLTGCPVVINGLAFSPDGRMLASAGVEQRLDPSDQAWLREHPFRDDELPGRWLRFFALLGVAIVVVVGLSVGWKRIRSRRHSVPK